MAENAHVAATREIIPTPQEVVVLGSESKSYADDNVYRIRGLGPDTQTFEFALGFLRRNLNERFGLHSNISSNLETQPRVHDLVVCRDAESAERETGISVDRSYFDKPNAREQGYIIENRGDAPVLLYAESDQGCLNGVATLLQLFRPAGRGATLDTVRIRDYPEFRFRGNKWTIWAELGVWSYDWGDGIEAFRKRTIRKLDMSVLYKINMAIFDGLGWDTQVFPEYASLMKDLNREAQVRGISLVHTGQSSGFCLSRNMIDPNIYRGEVLQNRDHYPDGDKYECIGGDIYSGTCLSNDELIERNLQSIVDFVEAVEPTSLYVHQLDILNLPQSMWDSRCPSCRAKWPDDRLDSEAGMAGAYASYYSELIKRINSVESSGYHAESDCLLMIVSPGYMDAVGVSDAEWEFALRYWSTVSRLMTYSANVYLGFREMFFNHGDQNRRITQLNAAINDSGKGHHTSIIHFYGGDGWQSEQLLLATPALNSMFLGAEMLLTASGHAFQEPQQLLNAEFMWNPLASPYRLGPEPENYDDFLTVYNESRLGSFAPDKIFGRSGFLEIACEKLYGDVAGPAMATLFRLRGKTGKPPVPFLRNKELNTTPGPNGALLPWIGFSPETKAESVVAAKITIDELKQTTLQARDLLGEIDLEPTNASDEIRDLIAFRDFLAIGVEYISYLARYVALYERHNVEAREGAERENGGNGPTSDINREVLELLQDVDSRISENRKSPLAAVDYLRGALSGRDMILRFVRDNAGLLQREVAGESQ